MPELPDLEVFSKNLRKVTEGRTITKAVIKKTRHLRQPAVTIKKALQGGIIKKVYREGKELRFELDNGNTLGLHLMLHGKLNFFESKNNEKHTVLAMHFDDGSGLAVSDFQKAAHPILNPPAKEAPDALSKELNFKYLKEKLAGKKTNIKAFLMDQQIIRGIGNAYSDEILWKAGIAPASVCHKIPDEKTRALAKAITQVLKDAEKQIRKINPGIISGEERSFLKIHNADKEKSPTGAKIISTTLNSRVTYYTREQKLYGGKGEK